MKIAIFQNFLDTIGGAEVVGLRMARELDADIFTTNVDREKIKSMGFGDVRVHSIGRVPLNAPFRQQITLWRFSRLKLQGFDFYIINGDWAVSAAARHSPNLWYVNATIREIWDMHTYVRKTLPLWQRPIFDAWTTINRIFNKRHVAHVDQIASNSRFTQERVKKYLGRESDIIHPPIDTIPFEKASTNKPTGEYWLSVNRLIGYKRVELQLKAFAQMPEKKLIIIGPYEQARHTLKYAEHIHRIKPANVAIYDPADNFELLTSFYAQCKGFITTCRQEDFGMTAIEAMAAGKPVIAPNEGGYKESIINGVTGILIDNINSDKIRAAVEIIESKLDTDPLCFVKACQLQAKRFDVNVFMKKIHEKIVKQK